MKRQKVLRLLCRIGAGHEIHSLHGPLGSGLIKEFRDSQWGLMGHLSRSSVCVSPYWYIRGVTPHCFIRRCRPERAPGFSKALRLGVRRRSRREKSKVSGTVVATPCQVQLCVMSLGRWLQGAGNQRCRELLLQHNATPQLCGSATMHTEYGKDKKGKAGPENSPVAVRPRGRKREHRANACLSFRFVSHLYHLTQGGHTDVIPCTLATDSVRRPAGRRRRLLHARQGRSRAPNAGRRAGTRKRVPPGFGTTLYMHFDSDRVLKFEPSISTSGLTCGELQPDADKPGEAGTASGEQKTQGPPQG